MRDIEELRAIAVSMGKTLDKLLYEMLSDAMEELDQYKNNWEELKRILEKQLIDCNQCSKQSYYFKYILDIMKELEEKNND